MNDYMYDDEQERKSGYKVFTFVLLLIHGLMAVGAVVFLTIVDVLPIMYLLLAGGCAIVGWLLQYFLLYKAQTLRGAKYTFSNILSIGVITVAIGVFISLGGFVSLFNNIGSGGKDEFDIYTVRVLQTSGYENISDIKGKDLGISEITEQDDLDKCMEELSSKLSGKPSTKSYTEDDSLAGALMDKKVEAILFDEALLTTVEENREGFTSKTKVLLEIKVPAKKVESGKRENIDITKDPFNILITGMDSSGKIAARGNSDVNIIATINPKTKKILLTSTPRDFYVPLNGDKNKYDKLTHAGNYGVDCSMATLSKFYNTPIDFYVKVNFTSVEDLVDALGGVTVNSDAAFTAPLRTGGRTSFNKGTNELDGTRALAFSRERKSLPGGDRARGKNQQLVISAIINKISSPAILTKYNKVLSAIEKNTTTDLTTDDMTSLLKFQIDNPSSWATESITVDGTGDNRTTHSYKSRKLYVMVPTESTVTAAKNMIAQYMK